MIAVAGCVVQASINWSETELVRLTALLGGAERLRGSGASLKQCCTINIHIMFILNFFSKLFAIAWSIRFVWILGMLLRASSRPTALQRQVHLHSFHLRRQLSDNIVCFKKWSLHQESVTKRSMQVWQWPKEWCFAVKGWQSAGKLCVNVPRSLCFICWRCDKQLSGSMTLASRKKWRLTLTCASVQLTGNAATRKFLMQLCSLTAQSPAIHHGRLGSWHLL